MKKPLSGTVDKDAAAKLTSRESALLAELETLLDNPRADEIMANDWLHDGSLPMPSLILVRYLGIRMLTGYGVKLEVARMDRYGFISKLVAHLRNESSKDRIESIPSMLRRLDCFRFQHAGKKKTFDPHAHEWTPILWQFLYPSAPESDDEAVAHAAGERMIARGLIETMTLRAVFTQDHQRVRSLSVALKNISQGQSTEPTVENRIKGEILRCIPYLNEKIGRLPSRAEIQFFARQCAAFRGEADFPARQNPWVEAFQHFHYPADRRAIRTDPDLMTRLAREIS
jgi:hypothetical protein